MLIHEINHALGLCHTDGAPSCPETLDPSAINFLSNVYTPPYVYPDGGWSTNPTLPSNTATNNAMGNTSAAAYFSPIQIGRMRKKLAQDGLLASTASGYSAVPLSITSNQTWDFPHKLYQDVVVKSGSKLTITCVITFVKEARIIVEPGAELLIDGGRLQSSKFEDTWQGIYVEGNSNLAQTPSNQGLVTVNGGYIWNAENGITNIAVDASGNWIWGTTGGIINCTNAEFRNNKKDVQLLAYISPDAKNEKYNASFVNCDFLRGNGYASPSESINPSITMWGVAGVDIEGCTFQNSNTGDFEYDGGAIFTIKASYKVNENSTGSPSIFKGYADAVRSESDISVAFPIKIIGSEFENNIHSVYLNSVVGSRVSHNEFKVRTSHSYIPPAGSNFQNSAYGVYLDYNSGFALEENDFENLDNTNNLSAAIVVKDNCGASDQVYQNTIDEFYYGIQAINNNQNSFNSNLGLNFICNDCGGTTANTKDIQVDANGEVAGIQGEGQIRPNNKFSPNSISRHFDNFGSSVITYPYGNGDPRYIPTQYVGLNLTPDNQQVIYGVECISIA